MPDTSLDDAGPARAFFSDPTNRRCLARAPRDASFSGDEEDGAGGTID